MTRTVLFLTRTALTLAAIVLLGARMASADAGVLLMAHGGSAEWNARVTALANQIDRTQPTEVAFGMATRATIQAGIDRLVQRGATEVVAVPLFVSSWSSVITSTEFLLGLRAEAPRALAIFAKMSHGGGGDHAAHGAAGADPADGTTPVKSPVPVRMTAALNDHPIVAQILASRASAISRTPAAEALVIVAHGPNEDADNQKWLDDMGRLAAGVREASAFASIDYLTLRDDAPDAVQEAATAQLRGIVEREIAAGRRVLIVPLLISFGGIEKGLQDRLAGLPYTMAESALVPDDRLVAWVLSMAGGR
jgi:sirohydrochlorin ferrochelatase